MSKKTDPPSFKKVRCWIAEANIPGERSTTVFFKKPHRAVNGLWGVPGSTYGIVTNRCVPGWLLLPKSSRHGAYT